MEQTADQTADRSEGQTVVVGVTGGIGAYKACLLVRALVGRGFRVKVTMTDAATRFVGPLTFRTLSGEPVAVSLWADEPGDPVHHVSLAKEADVMVVAPCTANVLAKLAHGRADDMLTTTALATEAPLVLAPAMNDRMWLDEATRGNVEVLRSRGAVFVGPGAGELACGDEGVGRLAEVEDILDAVVAEAARVRDLTGVRLLVTAGGTREPIDAVRFVGNRSTGKMGFAVAEEAARRGADVTVIAGAVAIPEPFGCVVRRVETAEDMRTAVLEAAAHADAVVMAAAVADYRPGAPADGKIHKSEGPLELTLERTTDILAELRSARGGAVLVGFAAEAGDPEVRAREKLVAKGCDLVVANDISREDIGFASDDNEVVFVTQDGSEPTGVMPKREIAGLILDRVRRLIDEREA